jgi:NitT/TauT family transport system ATP-binding protein
MSIQLKGIYKSFGGISLYCDFNIGFDDSTITCILGPSGCGKTTLLNIIGGTTQPDRGVLVGLNGKVTSYIFQDTRLLPWKTVRGNIEFVLDQKLPREERDKIVSQVIKLVDLDDFAHFYPAKLSGGMRQRVSIARAFAYPSDIILMDEPLKGLDIKLKIGLIGAFAHLWQTDRRTVVSVTHDVDEALLLGNEIVVLSQPPVRVLTHQRIDIPLADRLPDMPMLKEIKLSLLSSLGM